MRLTLTWAASSLRPRATGRPGGGAACARPGSRTSGKQRSRIAQMVPAVPTRLAEQSAPAMTLPTPTKRWQQSGTGRPMGERHQRLWQQTATAKQPGGVRLCGHRWTAAVKGRTRGDGCPQCAREARRIQTRQPSISDGAPHLLAEWDYDANETHGWHPDKVTLGSAKKVHWVLQDECKLGLVHRWQAVPYKRVYSSAGSPFPSGSSVCACNSLAVQCPEAADLWVYGINGDLTPHGVTSQCKRLVYWKGPDGGRWHQGINQVVNAVRRHEAKMKSKPHE